MAFLEEILAHKKEEVRKLKAGQTLTELRRKVRDLPATLAFGQAISRPDRMCLIAEVKRASPSKGLLREDFAPPVLARIYQRAGADAVSVLTDKRYFQGSLSDLTEVRKACTLPILRKEFVIDPFQAYQARIAGADAILLIVRALQPDTLKELYQLAGNLRMDCLVEVHNQGELEQALELDASIIGINNRNLDTFTIELDTTLKLKPSIPPGTVVVSESGIKTPRDIASLRSAGIDALLVGEAFMTSGDIEKEVGNFLSWMAR